MFQSGEPSRARRELAELAWDRYMSAWRVEGQEQRSAFIETIMALLEEQDRAWLETKITGAH